MRRHLGGCGGILQVDGYAAYGQLVRMDGGTDGPRLAGCWAHSRRRFLELHAAGDSRVATTTVRRMADLWKLESELRGQSPAARAAARREIFERFLTDGLIELDPNLVERAISPRTVTRKNSPFAGSDGGGRAWATIATLLQTCKTNNVDPTAWLTQSLARIANRWPSAEIDALMPWNYRP